MLEHMSQNPNEDLLKVLRTHEILADMDQKYGVAREVVDPAPIIGTGNVPANFLDSLRELNERRNAFLSSLEGLPREKFFIDSEEFGQIAEVASSVRSFLEKYERTRQYVRKEEQVSFDKRKMEELLRQLDHLNIWYAKFATECSGGASSDVPIQKYNEDEDSLYYMTSAGATMRLKTIELVNGLRSVVQPFTEKILFVGPNGELSEVPREGYVVEEYFTGSFLNAVAGEDARLYKPGLEIYRRGNDVAAIAQKNAQGQASFSPGHMGDRVNKIFFLR